jgi:polysaccharide deacetylase family protein (PEP-CTERM system associated)
MSSAECSSHATMSIDWEDFGQLFTKYHHGQITPPLHGAIERQTNIILDLLDETHVVATFFVLGMLAKARPHLVRQIAARGHEIALHGNNHDAMFTLSRPTATQDIVDSAKCISDIIGHRLDGYRAPFFSLIKKNLYLLDVLAEAGFVYDSSIFPIKLPRYGIAGFSAKNTLYELPEGGSIVELPLTVVPVLGRNIPVSGGGYIRLLPQPVITALFTRLRRSSEGAMIYMHPYEFDSKPLDVAANYPVGANNNTLQVKAQNARWNLLRSTVPIKLKVLLQSQEFVTCSQKATYVKSQGIRSKLLGRT